LKPRLAGAARRSNGAVGALLLTALVAPSLVAASLVATARVHAAAIAILIRIIVVVVVLVVHHASAGSDYKHGNESDSPNIFHHSPNLVGGWILVKSSRSIFRAQQDDFGYRRRKLLFLHKYIV
jgi:hypothetical protein